MEGNTKEEVKVLEEGAKKNAKKIKYEFPEGFFSKKRPQERPQSLEIPDDLVRRCLLILDLFLEDNPEAEIRTEMIGTRRKVIVGMRGNNDD